MVLRYEFNPVRLGEARCGMARLGRVVYGPVRYGTTLKFNGVRCGGVWQGLAR